MQGSGLTKLIRQGTHPVRIWQLSFGSYHVLPGELGQAFLQVQPLEGLELHQEMRGTHPVVTWQLIFGRNQVLEKWARLSFRLSP